MEISWITPKVGDVVLMKDGYENVRPSGHNHYGLVLGCFKESNDPGTRYLMCAPGKTERPNYQIKNTDFCVPARTFGNKNNTIFQFSPTVVLIERYPSDCFLESNRSISSNKSGQVDSVVGTVPTSIFTVEIDKISKDAFSGDMIVNLCHSVVLRYGIPLGQIHHVKDPQRSPLFLER